MAVSSSSSSRTGTDTGNPSLYRNRRYSSKKTSTSKPPPIFITPVVNKPGPVLFRSPSTPISVQFFVEQKNPISSSSQSHGVGSSSASNNNKNVKKIYKKTCVCSPTTHPGSYRCSMHRNTTRGGGAGDLTVTSQSSLKLRRSVMSKSLDRIGVAEGSFVKKALSTLIGTSSSFNHRRQDKFQSKPSRLSAVPRAEDDS